MKIDYKIIRSNRKTLSVSVTAFNEITVRCPLRMSTERIDKFVESKRGWIERIIRKNEQNAAADEEIVNYKKIYYKGKKLPLVIGGKNSFTETAVYVKSVKDVKKVFMAFGADELVLKAKQISEAVNLTASGFCVKAFKSRWGSCDPNGAISLNYMLLMLPPAACDYVIVHELCHTVHFNHSADFWKLVGKILPDYRNLKKLQKNFDYLTRLY